MPSPFVRSIPELTATVFDLPATLRLTEKTIKEAGLESRITLRAGDFNRDGLGGPYDVVLMSDILHYQTFDTNRALVKKVHDHLLPGWSTDHQRPVSGRNGNGSRMDHGIRGAHSREYATRGLLQNSGGDAVDDGRGIRFGQ